MKKRLLAMGARRPRVFCASLADWLDDKMPIEWLARQINPSPVGRSCRSTVFVWDERARINPSPVGRSCRSANAR